MELFPFTPKFLIKHFVFKFLLFVHLLYFTETSASFRGYPLKGKPLGLPEGYVGVVLHESVKPETEKCERKFYVTYKFSKIHYWNWDKAPSDNDSIVQALQWMDIAEAVTFIYV